MGAMPEYFAYQRYKIGNCVTIVAMNLTLDQSQLDPTADLRVYADVLALPGGTLSLPGRSITFRARQLISNHSMVDVSGSAPPPQVAPIDPPEAPPATGYGESGQPGQAGGMGDRVAANGQAAGQINVYAGEITGNLKLLANGGRGQQAQNGQRGGHGMTGASGADAIIYSGAPHGGRVPDPTPAQPGGRGGDGGKGGAAGKSGDGGSGGTIQVLTATAPAAGQIDMQVEFGAAGAGATPGAGGTHGDPGLGGRIAEWHYVSSHFQTKVWYLSSQRQPGSQPGNDGLPGDPAPPATTGKRGTAAATVAATPSDLLFYDDFLLAQYQLTFHQAELAYLASDFGNARTLYEWIRYATTVPAAAADKLAPEYGLLNRRVRMLINQLNQGLDYFGTPLNHVPIVSLAEYQVALTTMLSMGSEIEAVYNNYTAMLKAQQKTFADYDKAITQANRVIDQYKAQADQLVNNLHDLATTVDQLTDSQTHQLGVVKQADEAFQKAVEAQGQGCSFTDFLHLVMSIVSVAKDVFDIAASVETIGGVVLAPEDVIDLIKDTGKIVKSVNTIDGDVNSISKAWETIKPMNTPDAPDTAKLITKQDDFDKAIAPYLSLPQARNYKAQVHDYIGIIQARNAKLLAYTNTLVKTVQVRAKVAQKAQELARIQADKASQADPTLAPYRTLVMGLYQDFKLSCLTYLYQENQAYNYWAQAKHPFGVADNTFAELAVFHGQLQQSILDGMNSVLTPHQGFRDFSLTLLPDGEDNRGLQFDQFRTSGALTFQIPTDTDVYLGWAQVLANSFTLWIPGAKTGAQNNQLYIRLWHQGRVAVYDQQGGRHDYTHEQILSVYEYDVQNGAPVRVAGGSLGGDQGRIAVSPFAAWTIEIPARFNPGLDLSGVERIEFKLSGYALPMLGGARTDAV